MIMCIFIYIIHYSKKLRGYLNLSEKNVKLQNAVFLSKIDLQK